MTMESPEVTNSTAGSGSWAGPLTGSPLVMSKWLLWQGQTITPSATEPTGQPWWVQMALKALNSPSFGWVTTYFSSTTRPPPTATSEIATVVPLYAGIESLRAQGDQFQYGGPRLCENNVFPTADGKAHFSPVAVPEPLAPDGRLTLSTRRGKQFNTMVYAETDPLTGAARDAVLMSLDDAASMRLTHGDRIRLTNGYGSYDGRVHVAALAPGNLQVHWPEGNVLLSRDRRDPGSFCPDYNATVRVERL